jgi:hypothetical protein
VSTVLAAIACLSSLLLLWAALDSGNPGCIFFKFGLPAIPYPEIITMMYLKVRGVIFSRDVISVTLGGVRLGQQRPQNRHAACQL